MVPNVASSSRRKIDQEPESIVSDENGCNGRQGSESCEWNNALASNNYSADVLDWEFVNVRFPPECFLDYHLVRLESHRIIDAFAREFLEFRQWWNLSCLRNPAHS